MEAALDLGSSVERRTGSSPVPFTINTRLKQVILWKGRPPRKLGGLFSLCLCGGMVDTRDLKSCAGNSVRVRVPSEAPHME